MWNRWLARLQAPDADPHPPREIAMAVLLLECARADFERAAPELDAVRAALSAQFGVNGQELDALMARADASAAGAVSLHGPVSRLNAELDQGDKRALMQWLWRVAAADGRVDPHEEHLLRRLADLLHVAHADFVRARLAVVPP